MAEHLIREGLEHGFISASNTLNKAFNPAFVTNSPSKKEKVLTVIESLILDCKSFKFSVAFITSSGLASLRNVLDRANTRDIKGQILTSEYLTFTDPQALELLNEYDNIEIRVASETGFHAKGYLFQFDDQQKLILGSSNMTQNALSLNKEWNILLHSTENGALFQEIQNDFQESFSNADIINDEWLNNYKAKYQEAKKARQKTLTTTTSTSSKRITPNPMQVKALDEIKKLRKEGKNKALLISATGTGKTYLSAFDVKAFKPKKFLFVVHRLNIAKKALESFQNILGTNYSYGIYSGGSRDRKADFVFSTIQTISKDEDLLSFSKDEFDYIVIDETHRAGARSYQRLMDYFEPKFMLGMTATPERTDGWDVFKAFDYQIAHEIRLQEALEQQMLTPFHYFGVQDLTVNGELIEDKASFNKLESKERFSHIKSTLLKYRADDEVRGLIFCSTTREAKAIADAFNDFGWNSKAITGADSEDVRSKAIESVESSDPNRLKYLITVDVFNEGIDIPSINQVVMLRPTESAIVFVQQLGRGLRKTNKKEYLTVIDFIGNYKNNFLIPIALFGDNSYNKDNLRKLLNSGNKELPGASTISFDEITKEKIFESINSSNMSTLDDLKQDYSLLKFRTGRTPLMMDFIRFNSRDPFHYVKYSKSYYNFVHQYDANFNSAISNESKELLSLYSSEINNGKRVEESIILRELFLKESLALDKLKSIIFAEYGYHTSDSTIESSVHCLNLEFIRKAKNVVHLSGGSIKRHPDFTSMLENDTFKLFLMDSINYSIHTFRNKFSINKFSGDFLLYKKYSRKDVCRILNWDKDISSTLYGYRTIKSITPCFVTYNKSENTAETINYNDHFISQSLFAWESRSNRRIESNEIQNVIRSKRILLFIKKADQEGSEFYCMGDVNIVSGSITQGIMPGTGQPVVRFNFNLDHPVPDSIYDYITDRSKIRDSIQTEVLKDVNVDSLEHIIPEKEAPSFHIPLYNFYAAAGSFSDIQTTQEHNLIEVPEKYSKQGYFACKVVGESMNRTIPNGSICIFRSPSSGTRTGKILLVEYFNNQDPDFHSHFTIKTYSSSIAKNEDSWRHERIVLSPNSFNPEYEDLVFTKEDLDERTFNIVGEFVAILST